MDSRGVSLVELLVGISIIAIVMVVIGFEFFGWQVKYKVESEIKELVSSVMDARMRARQYNRMYFIRLDKNTEAARHEFVVYEDTDDNKLLETAKDSEVNDLTNRALPYRLDWNEVAGIGKLLTIAVDKKGFVGLQDLAFPYPSPPVAGEPDYMFFWLVDIEGRRFIKPDFAPDAVTDVSYDCVRIGETRVNIGKLDIATGVKCDEK